MSVRGLYSNLSNLCLFVYIIKNRMNYQIF